VDEGKASENLIGDMKVEFERLGIYEAVKPFLSSRYEITDM